MKSRYEKLNIDSVSFVIGNVIFINLEDGHVGLVYKSKRHSPVFESSLLPKKW